MFTILKSYLPHLVCFRIFNGLEYWQAFKKETQMVLRKELKNFRSMNLISWWIGISVFIDENLSHISRFPCMHHESLLNFHKKMGNFYFLFTFNEKPPRNSNEKLCLAAIIFYHAWTHGYIPCLCMARSIYNP